MELAPSSTPRITIPSLNRSPMSFELSRPHSDNIPRSLYNYEPPKHGLVTPPGEFVEEEKSEPKVTPPYPLPPKPRQNAVLAVDLKTPDNFVERDPRLIRLTGIHPFNVEAPLKDLYDEGFLTTKDLHYVRNHGAVPKVEDTEVWDWEFSVEGMVEKHLKMSLRDLIKDYDQVTYPITLVCAGNRRKEQNVVRKTKGFSWGAAGLSTALWTGVALGDLLSRAGPNRGARYVYFEGADKLPNGHYGTSVKLNWAMDPNRGMMVSYKMNGEMLHPDHGKPLRIVIPGQIGGRSVKWLKRIIVTSQPSDNWYHIYDNRVLPTMISPEESASLPETWKDERYAIYDLNTNSATCYPGHDEEVSLDEESYKFRGYAYAGGGKRVTRMEVSLDQGKTWTLANITYPEDQYRLASDNEVLYGGKVDLSWREACFCWCFWDLDIPLSQLQSTKDVVIRAMDDSMMVQPRDMYWSVLGMMNNPWYRVVIHKEGDYLRFEHPTQPALMPGGWMEGVKKEGGNLTNGFWGEKLSNEPEASSLSTEDASKEIVMTNPKISHEITLEELRAHENETSPWFVLNGQVYDGTPFLEDHPGGASSIINSAAQDISDEFLAIHSENAKLMMPEYHIGHLSPSALSLLSLPPTSSSTPSTTFLSPKLWTTATLTNKTQISPDTKIFHFTFPSPTQTLGLPIGQHLMLRLSPSLIRAYTPISHPPGSVSILIKIYPPTSKYPESGLSHAIDQLSLNSKVDFKGPLGKFVYTGGGICELNGKPRGVKRFVMVCAGSGITPIYQVLKAVLKDEEDKTKCLVLYGNREQHDILLKEELDVLDEDERCRVVYTLTKPGENWAGLKGRMDKEFLEREVGRREDGVMMLVCGPEGMEKGVNGGLGELGWGENDVVFF
ncbi:hypothetical protein QBC38DRAFT_466329 [Podospora fimiseda]|uniref:Nitrate reductase n=1 Tax=Podospora fimiseda TaxID=252190 RepID=A0AAN7BX58_9PEZI|nr:hypothetical protein QBC38DRAFT_466329 [Podospora fimiseda]